MFCQVTLSSDKIWYDCEVLDFFLISCCLQNQDLFVLPKELPLVLAFLKCMSEMGVQLKIDKNTSDSE